MHLVHLAQHPEHGSNLRYALSHEAHIDVGVHRQCPFSGDPPSATATQHVEEVHPVQLCISNSATMMLNDRELHTSAPLPSVCQVYRKSS